MHDLPWKYFWSRMRWFFLWFARVMGSQVKFTGKSHHKRLKSLFTVTNALFYFLHFTLWPEHTIPLTKDHRSLIPPLLPRVVYSDLTLWRHNSWCDAMYYSHPMMEHILYIRYGIYSPIFASKYKYEFKQGRGGGISAKLTHSNLNNSLSSLPMVDGLFMQTMGLVNWSMNMKFITRRHHPSLTRSSLLHEIHETFYHH